MSSGTSGDGLQKIKKRIKRLEEKYELSLDYELETDDKISNLYETLKIISAQIGVDMNYDYRKKGSTKKRSKRRKTKKKSRKRKKTKRN